MSEKVVARCSERNFFCFSVFQCFSSLNLILFLMNTASREKSPWMNPQVPFGDFFNYPLIFGGNSNPFMLQFQNSKRNGSIAYRSALKTSDQEVMVLDVSLPSATPLGGYLSFASKWALLMMLEHKLWEPKENEKKPKTLELCSWRQPPRSLCLEQGS